ncbi:hypothetical protein WR25_10205 [Diploscapter pachys]|uniref:alpha-1,2-Mannosidase n=1 Tax=Diploscapter pachys TaxID=2018661 RepID=A0A2A2LCX1_9BILA|nr:hypothetical protein WR25_10205 [Diploscapter pachys]
MGLRMHERYVVCVGVMFIVTVCLSSVFFLPTYQADEYLPREHIVPRVRDTANRLKYIQEKEAAELREKVEKANLVPPPIEKPNPLAENIDSKSRREQVKKMMKFAWDGYKQYAWGENELKPISKRGHSASIFGSGPMGASIIDAIDTLWIMDMKEEYEDAKKWIELNLDFKRLSRGDISVFETNIRFVGGLLSIYALTNDKMYLEKAEEIAKLLLPAFDTPTGIPLALINVQTGVAKNYGWASGGASILSEFGSLQLEFDYLSNVTGNPVFAEKVNKVRDILTELEKPDGLYPIYLNPKTGKWGQRDFSIGAMADSFYEYLLKQWVATGKKDSRTLKEYEESIFAMEKKMLYKSQQHGLAYFANVHGSRVEHKFEHLACFCGGMLALHANNQGNKTVKDHYMDLAEAIGETCHESYARTGKFEIFDLKKNKFKIGDLLH